MHLTICTKRQQTAFQISLVIQIWIGLDLTTFICYLMLQLGSAKATANKLTNVVFCTHLSYALGIARLSSKWGEKPNPPFPWSNTASNRAFYEIPKRWGTGAACRFIECQCLLEPTCMHRTVPFLTVAIQQEPDHILPQPVLLPAPPRKCRSSKQHVEKIQESLGQWQGHAPSANSALLLPVTHCPSIKLSALLVLTALTQQREQNS